MSVEDCPLCLRGYHQLSQHLRVIHKVKNKTERKLLLSIASGRVNVRKGTCPIAGCKKETTRLDRHLKTHTELTKVARCEALGACMRQNILGDLASLRASNPAKPMVSTLDLDEAQDVLDKPSVPEEEEECPNPSCKNKVKQLEDDVVDLNKQVDTLTTALRDITWRYRLLKRCSHPTPSAQVTKVTRKLLSALSVPGEEEGEGEPPEQPAAGAEERPVAGPPTKDCGESSRSFQTAYPFPDHMVALSKYDTCCFLPVLCALDSTHLVLLVHFLFADQVIEEFRGHHDGADPSPKLINNVSSKIFQIKNLLPTCLLARLTWPA